MNRLPPEDVSGSGSSPRAPQTDAAAALDFLAQMYGARDRHLVAIVPDGAVAAKTFSSTDTEPARKWLNDRNRTAGLYYTVNALKPGVQDKKATKAQVAEALFLHVDIDDVDALEKLTAFRPLPTVTVFSGGGYQALWRLQEPVSDLAAIEETNKALEAALGADHCHNIDRVLRLPGTVNFPNKKKREAGRVPKLAHVVDDLSDWTRAFSLEDFAHLPRPNPKKDPDPDTTTTTDNIPGNVDLEKLNLFKLGKRNARKVLKAIESGNVDDFGGDRSKLVFFVVCQLVRAEIPAPMIIAILTDNRFQISAHVLDQAKPEDYARRQVNRAIDTVEASKVELDKTIDRMNARHTYVYGEGVFRVMHDHELKRDYYDVKKTALLREAYLRAGSVCLNSRLGAAKWISAMVMLQPGLAVAQ